MSPSRQGFTTIRQATVNFAGSPYRAIAGLVVLLAVLFWSFWPALSAMGEKWATDSQYSHGFLVPLFAIGLLWGRRQQLNGKALHPAPWSGLAGILLGTGLHLVGAYYYLDWLDMIALLPVLAGLCLCVGGRPVLSWAGPSIAFLVFMLPLPYSVEGALSHPLQRVATLSSTYTLQTLGFAAGAEGNVIVMDNARVGVVEACNGLGMLVTFFALTTAVAMVARRKLLDTGIILLSAIPIALIANITRITVAGILHAKVGGEIADFVFHELAGWLMMPLALGLLLFELWCLDHVLLEPEVENYTAVFGMPASGVRVATAKPSTKPTLV